MNKILKRDGRLADFDSKYIYDAVFKAAQAAKESVNRANQIAESVRKRAIHKLNEKYKSKEDYPTVEEIQDLVVHLLLNSKDVETAESYIKYREERTKQRDSKSRLMQSINEITFSSAKDSNLKRDNGNVNGDTPMGMMLQYGSAVSKQFADDYLIRKDIVEHVKNGDIYIHDKDFLPSGTLTCCQLPLDKLFKNGFDTGHGFIREPQSIQSYASLTAIAIQSNQNDQHGGQSIPLFDFYLAPGITKTLKKEIRGLFKLLFSSIIKTNKDEIIDEIIDQIPEELFLIKNKDKLHVAVYNQYQKLGISPTIITDLFCLVYKTAMVNTEKQAYQAMESLIHNLNSMHSRAGAQVPFSSINFGMDVSEEGRMVSKNLLLAQEAGLGHGETPIFPILIFQVKEGVNYNPEDINYDLFKLSIRVSAKRLFPNFVFVDAPFNLQYYKPEDPETIIATMGCVDEDEVITYKIKEKLYVESFSRMWNRLETLYKSESSNLSEYMNLENVAIYDSRQFRFVKCLKLLRNPDMKNWYKITFTNGRQLIATGDHPLPVTNKGRTFIKDLTINDELNGVFNQYTEDKINFDSKKAWALGVMLCDSSYQKFIRVSLGIDEKDIVDKLISILTLLSKNIPYIKEQTRGLRGRYYDVCLSDSGISNYLKTQFEGIRKKERKIPTEVFIWSRDAKLAFLAGMIDADGYINQRDSKSARVQLSSTNKELALQQMLLAQALDMPAKIYENHYSKNKSKVRYRVEFLLTEELLNYIVSSKKKNKVTKLGEITPSIIRVSKIEFLGYRNRLSYDVETESDYFDVSGISSHNCRTRVFGNVNGKETPVGRGNLSFSTINLPRLGIKHGTLYRTKNLESKSGFDEKGFFNELDEMIELCIEQLLERYEIQKQKYVNNFPFLMGQGIWSGSEKLSFNEQLGDVINSGTLSVGFIGLAECLVALCGQHHGESELLQNFGLRIIGHMREKMDEATAKYHLNFSLLGTPAEGLSGTFTMIDKKEYGEIPGVNDREYYTNSFHIPVYYPISFDEKIRLEAPYHALTNAGHITYVEVDGDLCKNLDAFEAIIRCMKENGIGYGSVNHPIDRDPVCGYSGVIEGNICPKCGRDVSQLIKKEETIGRL